MYNVELNGVQLAVEEQGSGQAIIFVPGGLSDYRSWQPQVDLFSQRYHAISYSRRYQYPQHLIDGGNSSVSVNAVDLAALIDRLGVGPAHILAHSYGAFTALICAREHPELVRTLVLGEPPAVPLLVKNPNNPVTIFPLFFKNPRAALALMKFGVKGIKSAQEAFTRGDTEKAVQAFVRGITGRPIVVDELPSMIRESMWTNGEALRAELDVSDPFTCDDARRIVAPTLLIQGDESPGFLGAIMDRLARCLPNAEQVVLPGASHFLHWESPDEFTASVQAFLTKHSAGHQAEQRGQSQRMRRSS